MSWCRMAQQLPSDQHATGSYIAQAGQGSSASVNVYATPPHPKDLNRCRLLAKVRAFWIKGVLEQSLHGAVLLELGLQEQADAVMNPWQMAVQESRHSTSMLPSGTSITQVYEQAEGELLILGAPGSGKTTLLLQLARDLLNRAQQDEEHPLPVVFNLSSWAVKGLPLGTWLVEELNSKYQVPQKLGQKWVAEDHILPLLDGLDEVTKECRVACVEAINTYRREHGLLPMVVCCRNVDYEALGTSTHLVLQRAVVVQPLTAEQIDTYLASGGTQLTAIRALLQKDPDLQEMATVPLMLNVLILAYAGRSPDDLAEASTPELQRRQVFATYVERMLHRRGAEAPYTPDQTIYWLSWLAGKLQVHSQTVFHLERMQPTWLSTEWQSFTFAVLVRGTIGLLIGLIGLLTFMFSRLFFLFPYKLFFFDLHAALGYVQSSFSSAMLTNGLCFGLVSAVIYGLLSQIKPEIEPAEMISWSWRNIWERLGRSHVVGIGLLFGLLGGVLFSRIIGRLLFKLLGWRYNSLGMLPLRSIVFGALLFIFGGLLFHIFHEIISNFSENEQGVQSRGSAHPASQGSLSNRVLVGLISGSVIGLLFGGVVGLLIWLVAGLNARATGNIYGLNNVLLVAFHYGLIAAVLIGGIGGLALGSTSQVEIRFEPVRLLTWVCKEVWQRLSKSEVLAQVIIVGWIIGIFYGMHQAKILGSDAGNETGVMHGLLGGLAFGLFSILVGGLSSKRMEEHTLVRPNQGIRRSARNSVLIGLFFVLPAWLIFGVVQGLTWRSDLRVSMSTGLIGGLALALLSALLVGLPNGGIACIQHGILRLLLRQAGVIPRQYRYFLDYAAERILLRKVGGGYIFVHRLLLEHFVSPDATQPLYQVAFKEASSLLRQGVSEIDTTERNLILARTETGIAEVCTCRDNHRKIRSCPNCGKPRGQNRIGHQQDSSAVSSLVRSVKEHRWLCRLFHPSPLVLLCLGLLIALPIVSWDVGTRSHSFHPPLHSHQAFDDSLAQQSKLSWGEETDRTGDCRFANGGYWIGVTPGKHHMRKYCTAHNTDFDDFAFEAQMRIPKHGRGGLIFRNDMKSHSYYAFWIEDGEKRGVAAHYGLDLYQHDALVKRLVNAHNAAIRRGPGQLNTIAVIAQGDSFALYVNGKHVTTYSDPALHHGQIGLISMKNEEEEGVVVVEEEESTKVVFYHAKVWRQDH